MSVQSEIERIQAGKEDIRAAIMEKGQSIPATARLSSYGDKIRAIRTGVDTSGATATAGDILSGKTAYVDGEKVTGTIAGKSAGDLTASGSSIIVPAGYYPDQVSKSVPTAVQATPSIDVSSIGLITASATQAEGYVESGTKSASLWLNHLAAQTITPGTTDKTISSGQYLTGAQTIKGDANLLAKNIKKGISIFGVPGNFETVINSAQIHTFSATASAVDHGLSFIAPASAKTALPRAPFMIFFVAAYPSSVMSQGGIIGGCMYSDTARPNLLSDRYIPSTVLYSMGGLRSETKDGALWIYDLGTKWQIWYAAANFQVGTYQFYVLTSAYLDA